MVIRVEHVYKPHIAKLTRRGWKQARLTKLDVGSWSPSRYRECCGDTLQKDFKGPIWCALREAMQEFEHLTGEDVIAAEDQCGCSVYAFSCRTKHGPVVVSGWECGKYLYKKWFSTPRQCLEEMNA